jgi:hypothetical protein
MHVNNLGGARMPVTTTADRTTQTARTSFSTLVQGATSVPSTGGAAIPGSSIVARAISTSTGGLPGSGFGAPYLQTLPAGIPVAGHGGAVGVPSVATTTVGLPGVPGIPGAPNTLSGIPADPHAISGNPIGSQFNGEMMQQMQVQQLQLQAQMQQMQEQLQMMLAMRDLIRMSLMSFMQGTFALGQNRPAPQAD